MIPFLLEGYLLAGVVLRGWCSPSVFHTLWLAVVSLCACVCVSMTLSPEAAGWSELVQPPTGRRAVSSPQGQSCCHLVRLTALSDVDVFASLPVSIGMNHI